MGILEKIATEGKPVFFCGTKGHRVKDRICRTRRPRCINCRGEHAASYRGCPAFKKERLAQNLKLSSKINIHDARREVKKTEEYNPSKDEYPQLQKRKDRGKEDKSHENRRMPEGTPNAWNQRRAAERQREQDIQPIEGTRWGPPNQVAEPKPQRDRTRDNARRRESDRRPRLESEREERRGYTINLNEDDLMRKITTVVQDTIWKVLPKLFEGFAALMMNSVYAHGINEMGKKELIQKGIVEMCNLAAEEISPEPSTPQGQDGENDFFKIRSNLVDEILKKQGRDTGRAREYHHAEMEDEESQGSWNPYKGRSGWRRSHY